MGRTTAYRLINSEGDCISGLIVDVFEGLRANVQKEEEAIVEEFGVKFHVAPRGQKTGFYVDQRDNRSFISQISKGKDVLDICCYSGGFSIQAARGGAASVMGVDSSQAAIDLAQRNATLNGFNNNTCTFVKNDASKFMDESIDQKKQWDIVILDPPKLAPTRKSLTVPEKVRVAQYQSNEARQARRIIDDV
eukprot:jgi/Picre1/30067/NNA_005438.t1